MIIGIKYITKSTFYTVFKKHYCPICKTKLICVRTSKIVNSKSPEAKNYDFGMGDVFLVGDVKFIWKEFRCPVCIRNYSIDQMKRIEKDQKKLDN